MSVSKSASERWQGILTQSSPTVVGLCPRPGACGPARPPAPAGRAYVSQGQCSGDPGPRTSSFAPNSTFSPRDCVAVTFDVSQLTTPLQFTFAFVYCVTFRLSRDIYAAAQKSSPNRHRGRTLVNVLQSTPCRPPYVIALARSLARLLVQPRRRSKFYGRPTTTDFTISHKGVIQFRLQRVSSRCIKVKPRSRAQDGPTWNRSRSAGGLSGATLEGDKMMKMEEGAFC